MAQNLHFTLKLESDNSIAFLDVLVTQEQDKLTTSLYRKPTHTGLYMLWGSNQNRRYKLGLIKTLMSQRAPKGRLHVDIKRRWRSREQENKINIFLDSAYHLDLTNTDEEEINLHVTQEPVIDYSISSEIRTDSDSEFIRNENENNHDDDSIDDTYAKCGEVLLKSNDPKCSISCDSNGKYRSYNSKVTELAIMNVEREIKRVAERHIDLINECLKQTLYIFPADYISSNIYRQLPTNENQRNITIILHSDGAPAISVNNKFLWPVQEIIAEITIPMRDEICCFASWCLVGGKKPPRNPLLISIITQLEVLMRSPIVLKQKDGSRLSYNVRIQQAIFDLPARGCSLNIVQYNGYYRCSKNITLFINKYLHIRCKH
ncbi:unnamed protein product [Rotaria socialis]|uniref:Uncharacterized protein n=1 Tax=Rotaria socialis TaxID=392032 RepID=A0A818BVF9_9BILA|nr:unnamed protein product [Rotaria socialis]CAF3424303.1 unnamed protein product [Rotaria socialis]